MNILHQNTIMITQIKTVYLLFVLHCVASSEVSVFKSSNFAHAHHYKNSILNHQRRKPSSALLTPQIEYMETPNFEIMLLSEENSNPIWRKYSQLFQPKDLHNAPHIEVNYGNYENFPYPFINMDRSEIEAVLFSLGDKKHIFVVHPRNCKPHLSSLDEFENEFLPKLLQKLHKQIDDDQRVGSVYMDPVVDRILNLLDSDEQQMLNDLRKSYENPIYANVSPTRRNNVRPMVGTQNHQPASATTKRVSKKEEPKSDLKDMLFQIPCNEGYVFLVENQKNPINPNSLNDLLLRVMKVVTEFS